MGEYLPASVIKYPLLYLNLHNKTAFCLFKILNLETRTHYANCGPTKRVWPVQRLAQSPIPHNIHSLPGQIIPYSGFAPTFRDSANISAVPWKYFEKDPFADKRLLTACSWRQTSGALCLWEPQVCHVHKQQEGLIL